MVVLCYLVPPWQNLVLIVYHQALLAKTIHYREFKNISVLTSSCEININENYNSVSRYLMEYLSEIALSRSGNR